MARKTDEEFKLKNVAVIGGGFAGVAAAYSLSEKARVTLYDSQGIGGGASGVSSGLLHPYPGEKGRLSWKGEEALSETMLLLKVAEGELGRPVADYRGILKKGLCVGAGGDVETVEEGQFLIRSGVTVFSRLYLQGLWKAAEKRGARLKIQKIQALSDLSGYDYIVVAAGQGVQNFEECRSLKISTVRGQVLTCRLQEPMERTEVAKHYKAVTEDPMVCQVGGTYERGNPSHEPDQEEAVRLLQPALPVLGVRAGIRVTNPSHYFPILERVNEKTWVLTAFGSRGLLYHAYFAKLLTAQIDSA